MASTFETYSDRAVVETYDQQCSRLWKKFPREIVRKFKGNLPDSPRVLNVGSGTGRDSAMLEDAGLNVVCIDLSRPMTQRSAGMGFDSVQGSFFNLPFQDGSFDGVWTYKTLVHAPLGEIWRPLMEIRRVLTPEGVLALGMIEGHNTHQGVSRTYGKDLSRDMTYYTQGDLEKIINNFGFERFDIRKVRNANTVYISILARKRR